MVDGNGRWGLELCDERKFGRAMAVFGAWTFIVGGSTLIVGTAGASSRANADSSDSTMVGMETS